MIIGKFKEVPLRDIWKHEALDFTNWLAMEENLELLSEELGIGIVSAQTEVGVGKFAVDILAEDDNGDKVIIENQLGTTDHDHLGKIITYAAGLQAETIIWIVAEAREEHEQAVIWLNENTGEKVNCFLIEIEAWRIDDSAPAPRFNIIAKPNDWAKIVKQARSSSSTVSDFKLKQQEFFRKLREYGEKNSKYVKSWQKPLPQHWYNVRVGSSKAKLAINVNSRESYVGVNLEVWDDKDLFEKLMAKRDDIERKLGFELEWELRPDRKGSHAIIKLPADIEDEESHDRLIAWLLEKIDAMSRVFPKYLS